MLDNVGRVTRKASRLQKPVPILLHKGFLMEDSVLHLRCIQKGMLVKPETKLVEVGSHKSATIIAGNT